MPADQANPIRRTVERPPGALGLLEPLIERNRRDIEELIDQDDALRDRNERLDILHGHLCKVNGALRQATVLIGQLREEGEQLWTELQRSRSESRELEAENIELLAELQNFRGEVGVLKAENQKLEVVRENLDADNERLVADNLLLGQQLVNQQRRPRQPRQRAPARAAAPAAGSGAVARIRAPARGRARIGASAGVVQHRIARQPPPVRAPRTSNRPSRACTAGIDYRI